uniref:MIR domain-containing protein n=2 Tax=Leptocylindrus danicus TaxID=163516 RepID=A0A7S2LH23_9STRA
MWQYPGSSKQRVVTMSPHRESADSLWLVREASGQPQCLPGQPIKCGSRIRLTHLQSNKNLHSSRNFHSPLSKQQETHLFGDNGEGDFKDDWVVVCKGDKPSDRFFWQRDSNKQYIQLKHAESGAFLSSSYTLSFGPNTPRIENHLEVSGTYDAASPATNFQVTLGIHLLQ